MLVLLTSKPGVYRTEPDDSFLVREAWDYWAHGVHRARFTVAEALRETRVRIVDLGPPEAVALVPSKLLPRYESVEAARAALRVLVGAGSELRAVP